MSDAPCPQFYCSLSSVWGVSFLLNMSILFSTALSFLLWWLSALLGSRISMRRLSFMLFSSRRVLNSCALLVCASCVVAWLLFLPDPCYFSLIFATLSICFTWESSSSFFRARLLLCSDSMDWFLKAMTSGTSGGVRGVYFLLSIFVQSSSLDVTLWTLFFLPSL